MNHNILFRTSILLFLLFGAPIVSNAEYSGVYEVWYDTTKYPESSDEQIAKNQSFFDNQFFSCLTEIRLKSMYGSVKWGHMCNEVHEDSQRWAGCNSADEAGKTVTWTREMEATTRGEVKWSKTLNYLATMTGKRTLGAKMYESIVDQTAPSFRPVLICK